MQVRRAPVPLAVRRYDAGSASVRGGIRAADAGGILIQRELESSVRLKVIEYCIIRGKRSGTVRAAVTAAHRRLFAGQH